MPMRKFSLVGSSESSDVGYPEEYLSNIRGVEDQIDTLRMYWPDIDPDEALRYADEVYPNLDLPDWVEGPFVILRPGYLGSRYSEEVIAILQALSSRRKFRNYCTSALTDEYIRRYSHSLECERKMARMQSGDLWVVGAQFGSLYQDNSVASVQERVSSRPSEWAFGARDVGSMILTHPERFAHKKHLHVDCPGDLYSRTAEKDSKWDRSFLYRFEDGKLRFSSSPIREGTPYFGAVTGYVPSPTEAL